MKFRFFCLLALTSLAGNAGAMTFSDMDFADADWSVFEALDLTPNDSFTFSGVQSATGGNPGAYREVVNQIDTSTPSSIAAAHVYAGGSFDPGEDGAFVSIDFSMDGYSEPGNPAGAMGYAVLLVQDGNFFRAGLGQVLSGAGWMTFSATGLTAASFLPYDGVSQLDLSNAGSAVGIGFAVGNGTFGSPSINVGRVDNWSFTINTAVVPLPAPLLLFAGALPLVLLRARRRA